MIPDSPSLGSYRVARPGFEAAGPADSGAQMRLVVIMKPRHPLSEAEWAGVPWSRRRPAYEDHVARYGARRRDIAHVVAFARASQLEVLETRAAARMVILTGSVGAVSAAFRTPLTLFQSATGESYIGYTGELQLPEGWSEIVVAVAGVDQRPMAQRMRPPRRTASPGAFTVPELANIYGFPTALSGAGQCVGILEFGGWFAPGDPAQYFSSLGIEPAISTLDVGGKNMPGVGSNWEVTMDLEIAGALAPDATIVCYFGDNSEAGWLEALAGALHGAYRPTVLSTSWGNTELEAGAPTWTRGAMRAVELFLWEAAILGVTVFVAAGDYGSSDAQPDKEPHVRYPASSPYVVGCGGTTLTMQDGVRTEIVWNDADPDCGGATGGGVSAFFERPRWQRGVVVPRAGNGLEGRGVPDVAAHANICTGYRLYMSTIPDWVSGGTSAVAPLWAGLIARINQRLAALYGDDMTVGYLTPWLYSGAGASPAFHDVTVGSNGAYTAGVGWDPCTGWGTPDGTALMNALLGWLKVRPPCP